MSVNIIACINESFQLGDSKTNNLLYSIKNDLNEFRKRTLNNYVVMGKNTFRSLKKPFDNRVNVIISSNLELTNKYCDDYDILVEDDLEKVLNQYKFTGKQNKDLFLCGGARIYSEGIKFCDNLYITMVHEYSKPNGDVYFPSQELSNFTITHKEKHFDEECGLFYSFINYKRKENVIED